MRIFIISLIRSEGRACSDLRVWEIDNTTYQNLNYREKKFVYATCKFQGFRVDGERTIECVHGQPAKPLPQCKPMRQSCRPLDTPFFGWKSCSPNDKDIGSVCTFECNDTHYLRGSKERRCTRNHEWSGAPARCILKPECSLPVLDDKIQTECSFHRKVKLNEVCTFSCVEGFQLKGPDQLTCQLNGLLTDNKGSQTYPSCHSE
ncbi:signal peptide, CUB and EGF-like domain-containing protein 2 [Caerostris extrusa]|uniref:Signal peptide, CUB and EGF-like domain-containing protein 2 n=1 Tax=Caerostris extrusa TaxID=172846 RepID=A0AAV4XHL2_CAEEX|nr:signal peptide, CUB and EGF-like domain-containing protein 2 [Caerostris extrusa]